MDRDLLKACIEALKLLARKHQAPEAGVAAELEVVILQLESCLKGESSHVEVPTDLRIRALNSIAECLTLVTNLSELVHRFFGPS